jgi:hypothetical protein
MIKYQAAKLFPKSKKIKNFIFSWLKFILKLINIQTYNGRQKINMSLLIILGNDALEKMLTTNKKKNQQTGKKIFMVQLVMVK